MNPTTPAPPGSGPSNGLAPVIEQAGHISLFNKLRHIYQELPDTSCLRQGYCCSLLPPSTPVEMVAWLAHQASRPGQERGAEAARLVEHFLLNAAVRRPCPWAMPRACAVYERRFLACRAYGLWSARAYETRRQAAEAAQERVAQAWQGLGMELPPEVLAPGPGYCMQVRLLDSGDNRPMSASERDATLEKAEAEVEALEQLLPGLEPFRANGGDLSYLLARLCLGERACLEAKVEATRALLEGRTLEAAEILNQNMNIAYNYWSSWTI